MKEVMSTFIYTYLRSTRHNTWWSPNDRHVNNVFNRDYAKFIAYKKIFYFIIKNKRSILSYEILVNCWEIFIHQRCLWMMTMVPTHLNMRRWNFYGSFVNILGTTFGHNLVVFQGFHYWHDTGTTFDYVYMLLDWPRKWSSRHPVCGVIFNNNIYRGGYLHCG